jgi:hypothetical protein
MSAARKGKKSWLCQQLAHAVSTGTEFTGKQRCEKAKVLYINLEQSERIAQERSFKSKFICNEVFLLATQWSEGDHALQDLEHLIKEIPEIKLVIIDVMAIIFPEMSEFNYFKDYKLFRPWRQLAHKMRISILFVTHQRKMAADDVFDMISGSTGITANSDFMWVLKSCNDRTKSILEILGNDIPDGLKTLRFNFDIFRWEETDEDPLIFGMTPEQNVIFDLIKNKGPLSPSDIAKLLGKKAGTMSKALQRMKENGILTCPNFGVYQINTDLGAPKMDT